MSHFAEVVDGIVTRVIVAEQDFIDSGAVGYPSNWIQTSYNTRGAVHETGGVPLRKNFAGVGYTYDPIRDAFIEPKPFPSWVLDEQTCLWVSPVPMPEFNCLWDEASQSWEAV